MNSHTATAKTGITTRPTTLALLAGAALAAPALAQPYERAIGDPQEQRSDWVISVQTAAGGDGSAHAGTTRDNAGIDMYIARLDNPGATIWDTRIGTPTSTDTANRVELSQTPDDGYLVAGESDVFVVPGIVPFGISLTRLDVNGTMLWSRLFQGTPFAGGSFGGTGLEVLSGNSLLCGRLQLQQFADQGAVVHYVDASGNLIWGKYYADFLVGQPSFNSFHDIEVVHDSDGAASIIAVGYTAPASWASRDTLVVKLDFAGNVLWANTYGPDDHSDVAMGVEPAANGDILVTGYTKEAGEGGGAYIMRLDPLGNMLWWKDYFHIDASGSIHEESNGDIVVAGTANDFNTGVQDLALMQTDPGGNLNWVHRYGGDQREHGEACDISPEGYVMSAWTESFLFGSFDLYALAADPAGKTGCEQDWGVVVTPRQYPVAGHFFLGYDIPDQITPPFEQDFPFFDNETVCDPDPCPECSAQWAAPFNVSDFSDIIAFLNAYSVCDPCVAQLAPPLNVCDFSDVVAFLTDFATPCP